MTNKQKIKNTEGTKKFVLLFWLIGILPLALISSLLLFQPDDTLPSVTMLDNPPELLASVVLTDDGNTELGRSGK